ncbi:MAG: hypothetical protein RRZ64_03600 [Rikenellaceae bacterium]
MKKLLFLSVAFLAMSFSASAQLSKGTTYSEKNAIGLRLGYGVEASYQRTLNNSNRIEADLGFMSDGFSVAGIYQWVWSIDKVQGLGWYAGPGVGLGVWDDDFNISIDGQIGLEYGFKIPLSLSIDWRPSINFMRDDAFGWDGFALGVRYRF